MVSTPGFQSGYNQFQSAAAPDALAGVRQRLAQKPLNASRVVELGKDAHGQDGAPIGIPSDRLVALRTGNPVLDQANETASKVSKFGLKSSLDVAKSTFKGGLYGSTCGSIVGFLHSVGGAYLQLWPDGGRIVAVAAIIAVAVNTDGRREVLGIDVMPSEAEASGASSSAPSPIVACAGAS